MRVRCFSPHIEENPRISRLLSASVPRLHPIRHSLILGALAMLSACGRGSTGSASSPTTTYTEGHDIQDVCDSLREFPAAASGPYALSEIQQSTPQR